MNIITAKNIGRTVRGAAVLALACLAFTTAKATIITFNNGGSFPNYYEGGYVVKLISGPLSVGFYGGGLVLPGESTYVYGEGPHLVTTYAEFEVQRIDGAWFNFNSLDMGASPLDIIYYTFAGKANGVTVASGGGAAGYNYPDYFRTLNSGSSAQMDSLFISLREEPYDPGSYAALSHINVTQGVPDPASTVGLLAMALVPLLAIGIRQRRSSVVA